MRGNQLNWPQPSSWDPRERQGAQSPPVTPDCPRPGRSQLRWAGGSSELCPRGRPRRRWAPISPRCLRAAPGLRVLSGGNGRTEKQQEPSERGLHRPEEKGLDLLALADLLLEVTRRRRVSTGLRRERGAVAQHLLHGEQAALPPPRSKGLGLPGPNSAGALPSLAQATASPSLTGMLMWALSRGALWPSRSTSTCGGVSWQRGHAPGALPPAQSALALRQAPGLCPQGGRPLPVQTPTPRQPRGSVHTLPLSPRAVPMATYLDDV